MELLEFRFGPETVMRGLFSRAAKSRHLVVCLPGFERVTLEKKFKILELKLRGEVNFLCLDYPGLGLSDGSFSHFTINGSALKLKAVLKSIREWLVVNEISFIGHSLGCAVISQYLLLNQLPELGKVVFLSPALNQANLFRYWFIKNKKLNGQNKNITWQNYNEYFNEKEFLDYALYYPMMTDSNALRYYYPENIDRDFNDLLAEADWLKIFVVHGQLDNKVPLASNQKRPDLLVKYGFHDLERPADLKIWVKGVIAHLRKK